MSNNVDKRVVQMIFDNDRFESKVRTTINTLNSLKKSMNLNQTAKEFDKLENEANESRKEFIKFSDFPLD